MSPNRAIAPEKSRLLAELHRDSLYPMIGRDAWVAGADRRGSPRAEACASGASPPAPPASHPDPGSSGMVEIREESPKIQPLVLARRRPTVDRPFAAAGAQRQRLRPACRLATSRHAYSLIALLLCPNPPSGPAWCPRDSLSPPKGRSNRGSTKRTTRTLRLSPAAACMERSQLLSYILFRSTPTVETTTHG